MGFGGQYPHQRGRFAPSFRLCSADGFVFFQSKGLDVLGGIAISVMDRAAGSACPFPLIQGKLTMDPSAVAACFARWLESADAKDVLPLPFGFVFKHGHEYAPCGIGYALSQAMVPYHAFDVEVLNGNGVVVLDQLR